MVPVPSEAEDGPTMAEWLADPHNFQAALLVCHLAEQDLQARSGESVYTPSEITGFMSERTIESSLLDDLDELADALGWQELDRLERVVELLEVDVATQGGDP